MRRATDMKTKWLAGLDLGQSNDWTALAILEQTFVQMDPNHFECQARIQVQKLICSGAMRAPPDYSFDLSLYGRTEPKYVKKYKLRYLQRWVGVSYPEIVRRVCALFEKPPLRGETLIVDRTGVGAGITDMLREAKPHCQIRGVTITGGHQVNMDDSGNFNVPKKDLVASLTRVLQGRRLGVPPSLPNSVQLVRELQNFKLKMNERGSLSYESWRESIHDDCVLATSLACWMGERGLKQLWAR
jgi:hypothetical protein